MKIFHRIDDICEFTEEYIKIIDYFEHNTKEYILAAIPSKFSSQWYHLIYKLKHGLVFQHGYEHINRVDSGWCDEFPDNMNVKEKRFLLKSGKDKLENILNKPILGYVPPWNNASQEFMHLLYEFGFRIYSAQENNTNKFLENKDICIDIVDKYLPYIKYKCMSVF